MGLSGSDDSKSQPPSNRPYRFFHLSICAGGEKLVKAEHDILDPCARPSLFAAVSLFISLHCLIMLGI